MKKRLYFENLDGLRFIAFLLIFFMHAVFTDQHDILQNPFFRITTFLLDNGDLGVNFFFVLSGFLISYIFFEEKKIRATIDIRSFYVRKALRILPLYFFCVLFGFVVFPIMKQLLGGHLERIPDVWYYLSFTSNFDIIANGLPDASILAVLWAVSVEIQFYLVWPYLFLLKDRYIPWVFGAVILLSALFRFSFADQQLIIYFHTVSVISDMGIGGLLAYCAFYRTGLYRRLIKTPKMTAALVALLTVTLILFRESIFAPRFLLFSERLVFGLLFGFIIVVESSSPRPLLGLARFARISRWGRRSYGLYVLHMIGILSAWSAALLFSFEGTLVSVLFFTPFVGLGLTLFMASLSHRYFESPFLKMKDSYTHIRAGNLSS